MFGIGGGYSSKDTSSAFQKTGTTSGTSSTTANKLPEQLQSAPDIFAVLHKYLMDPQAAVNPARIAGRNQVNNDYSGLADRVNQKFLTTGGGNSGKRGKAQLAAELGRSGSLADVDNSAAVQASQLPLTATQLAEAFLGIDMGRSTTGNQTDTQTGTASGNESGWGVNAKFGV